MPLPLRRIEERIGQCVRKTPVAANTFGRALKEAGRGWTGVGHGTRSASPPMTEMVGLALVMLLGPPSAAPSNLETYGALRIEAHSVFAGGAQAEQPTVYHGRLEQPLEVAGVPIMATLVETLALYAEAFAGPARDRLNTTLVTVRIVKDTDFPYAVVEVTDGPRRHELAFWPANIDMLMQTGIPPQERTFEESVTLWPALFRGLADIWLATRLPKAKSEGADALAGAPALSDRPPETGLDAHAPRESRSLDSFRQLSAGARERSSPSRKEVLMADCN